MSERLNATFYRDLPSLAIEAEALQPSWQGPLTARGQELFDRSILDTPPAREVANRLARIEEIAEVRNRSIGKVALGEAI